MVDPYGRFNAMDAEAMIDVMSVVRLCRFVRIFALIDAVFLLIYGLQAFYFIILAVLAIAGYWGAKNLDRKYLFMYCGNKCKSKVQFGKSFGKIVQN